MLSANKPIPVKDRLIVALDVSNPAEARRLVETLGEEVTFYKIGLELFMAGDYFDLIAWLTKRGKKVFADLKFYDIPATVERAVAALSQHPVTFATVHGDRAIMAAAARAKGKNLKILAVTVLTSLDQAALTDMGCGVDLPTLVLQRARQAVQVGLDGVIASGRESSLIREAVGTAPLIVTPGVRPQGGDTQDQKRVVTVEEAVRNGADYIVVGRPIRDAGDPKQAARAMQERIARLFPMVY